MRKVKCVKSLMAYFDSVNYPMTKENLIDRMARKEVPHISPISGILIFDLNHIDWRIKPHVK